MIGLWLEEQKLTLRNDLPKPGPAPGESLVRVLVAGICNTDIELTRGYYPFRGVPGHEFVGVVESGPLEGKRVVGEINAACEACCRCRSGMRAHCGNRTVLGIAGRDGAFAEHLVLPSRNLLAVPESVDSTAAVFAEPLAAALQIQEQVQIGEDDRVLVVGDGKLGQLIAQTLALAGCRLFVVGRHENKRELLRRRGIATVTSREVEESGFDLSVECTGSPGGFELARSALRPRGTLVMKSTYAGRLNLDAAPVVVDELTIVGSRCGPFSPAVDLLSSGAVDVAPLISDRLPIADGLEAFERATRPGALKILLDIAEG